MQLFDISNLERAKSIDLDVFNLFNFYDTKNSKEYIYFKNISQERITKNSLKLKTKRAEYF